MGVDANTCNSWLTEVETALVLVRRREAGLSEKRDHKGTQATVDMEGDLV